MCIMSVVAGEKEHCCVDDVNQIEISHGSTSNQPSIYESNVTVLPSYSTFFCDVFLLLLASFALVVAFLLSFEQFPYGTVYLYSHPIAKISIITCSSVVTVILSIVFVVRCCRRCLCFSNSVSIWVKCKCPKPSSNLLPNNRETEGEVSSDMHSPNRSNASADVRLNQLDDSDLLKVKYILSTFMNHHDDTDWTFSICSQGRFNRKQMFHRLNTPHLSTANIKFTVKVVLVGSANAGKTSIFHRILYDNFTEYYMATLGADLGHTTLHIFPENPSQHLEINIQLWDIAGSERFSDLAHVVYKDTTSFIVVCDVSSISSTAVLSIWIKDIKESAFEPHISLFYNKIDLDHDTIMGDTVDELDGFEKYTVSAKTGQRVLVNLTEVIAKSILHDINKLL